MKIYLTFKKSKAIFVILAVLSFAFSSFFIFNPPLSISASPSDFGSSTLLTTYGLNEGDLISAIFSDDPDVYIVNEHGYKRLFLNPEIFKFYSHLGGFTNVKLVTSEVRDSFPTAGLFRNCEDNDERVFGIDVEGEDQGQLHWVNTTGDKAVKDDPDFFKKVFCINKKEFNWYKKASEFKSVTEVPKYDRIVETTSISTQERLEAKSETKNIGKVIICHYPPENIQAYQTLTIDASALKAHLDHGDTVGACFSPTPTPSASSGPTPSISPGPTISPLATPTATASPSPTSSASYSPTPVPTATTTATPVPTTGAAPPPVSSTPTPTPTSSSASSSTTSVVATLGTNRITLNWSGTSTAYLIHRSINGGAYESIFSAYSLSYVDYNSGFVSGSTYRYKVYGCEVIANVCQISTAGMESNIVTYTGSTLTSTKAPPPVTTDFKAKVSGTTIILTWTDNSTNMDSLFSIRRQNPDGTFYGSGIGSHLQRAIVVYQSNLSVGTYIYTLYTYNQYGDSGWTAPISATVGSATPTPTPTPTPIPTPDNSLPNNPSAVTGYVSGLLIYLNWTDNSSNETGFDVYRRKRADNSPGSAVLSDWVVLYRVGANTTSYTDSPYPGYSYEYRIGACNNSTASDPIQGTVGCASNSSTVLLTLPSPVPTPTPTPTSTPTPTPTPATSSVSFDNFSRDLAFGSRGNDVKQLQALLVGEVGYSADLVTGYFGRITRDAVKRLQEKYSIKPVSGYFGEITRRTLKALISH